MTTINTPHMDKKRVNGGTGTRESHRMAPGGGWREDTVNRKLTPTGVDDKFMKKKKKHIF